MQYKNLRDYPLVMQLWKDAIPNEVNNQLLIST